MEEVQYRAEAAQQHQIPPAKATIYFILPGTSKRVFLLTSVQTKWGHEADSSQAWELVAPDTLCHCVVWSNKCGGKRKDLSQNPMEVGCGGSPLQ